MSVSEKFEIRAITKEERAQYNSVIKYVFADGSQEDDEEDDDPLLNEWTTVAFYRGKLVATSGAFPFKMRFNGKPIYADGLTNVGTEPGFRRRGLVRELVTRRLQTVHEHEHQSVSILWASMGAIYQRFGYGLGSTHTSSAFDPRFAEFQFPAEVDGYVKLVEEKEGLPITKKLYRQFIEDRTLDLHRVESMWKGYFGTKKSRAYCAVYFNVNDEPEGYLAYRTSMYKRPNGDEAGPDQRMWVREFIYKNIQAYRALWQFIREHDLVGKVEMAMPVDDPAMQLVLEPRNLQLSVEDGLWLRIVDVSKALEQRLYTVPGEIVLEIKNDRECPWNERRYLLETDGEISQVAETNKSPQATLSPNGLASLLSGNASLSQLARVGRADVENSNRSPLHDLMFSTKYRPYCRNGF